jgi:SAD/SRA domain
MLSLRSWTYPSIVRHYSASQKGVSGRVAVGCSALFVFNSENVDYFIDTFYNIQYGAKVSQGAKTLHASLETRKPIRVFRASRYIHGKKNGTTDSNRYDGLYVVEKSTYDHEVKLLPDHVYVFHLTRIEVGIEVGPVHNMKEKEEVIGTAVR